MNRKAVSVKIKNHKGKKRTSFIVQKPTSFKEICEQDFFQKSSIEEIEIANCVFVENKAEVIEQIDQTNKTKNTSAEKNLSVQEKTILENASKTVEERSSKKKRRVNAIFMVVNILVIAAILCGLFLKNGSVISFSVFSKEYLSFSAIVAFLGVFFLIALTDSARIATLMKISTGKFRFGTCFKTQAVGRYYDCITPMAVGGQPFQVFYLKKFGVPSAQAISIPVARYVFGQYVVVLVGTIACFSSLSMNLFSSPATAVANVMGWIGLSLVAIISFGASFLCISQKLGNKIVKFVISFLKKIRLVKNEEKVLSKVSSVVADFQLAFKTFSKKPLLLCCFFVLNIFQILLQYSIPFIILCAFCGPQPGLWWQTVVVGVMVDMAASYFPLPGGTGAAELTFSALFSSFFGGEMIFWVLIVWKITTYYLFVIQGPLVMAYDSLIGNKNHLWNERKKELRKLMPKNAFGSQISFLKKDKNSLFRWRDKK